MGNGEDGYHLGIKALIRNTKGEILLLQVNPRNLSGQSSSYWDLPGGRVQYGDTIIDTLHREVEEETGIVDISEIQQIGMVLSNIRIPVKDQTVGLILGIYSCSIKERSTITLSDEHTSFQWFNTGEASRKLAVKYPADFCEKVASLNK